MWHSRPSKFCYLLERLNQGRLWWLFSCQNWSLPFCINKGKRFPSSPIITFNSVHHLFHANPLISFTNGHTQTHHSLQSKIPRSHHGLLPVYYTPHCGENYHSRYIMARPPCDYQPRQKKKKIKVKNLWKLRNACSIVCHSPPLFRRLCSQIQHRNQVVGLLLSQPVVISDARTDDWKISCWYIIAGM